MRSSAPTLASSKSIPATSLRRSRRSSTGARPTTSSARPEVRRSESRRERIPAADEALVVVAALGDSITEGSPGYDVRLGGDEESQWEHWAARADPTLDFRNGGVYGERTDEIAARLDGCAAGADLLVVQGGINDLAQGRPVEDAARNLRAMVRRGRELRPEGVPADVLPRDNGWPPAEGPL